MMYREVRTAARLSGTVTVLPYKDLLLKYPGMSQQAALDAYEQQYAHKKEDKTGK
jgi:hypothetical protein